MLEFSPLTLQELPHLAPWFAQNADRLCDGTVGGEFLWRDYYHIRYAVYAGALCLMADYPQETEHSEEPFTAFSYPIGGDAEAALQAMAEYAHARNMPLIICPASAADTARILAHWPLAVIEPRRQWYDYLYAAQDLRALAGRRFGGQRNHVNRFMRENPDWHFEKLGPENLLLVRQFFETFLRESGKEFAAAAEESAKVFEVLQNWAAYGFVGGVLFVQQQVAAFALGEIVGDTLYVHTEKASLAWHGTYPMIVQQMAQAYTPGEQGGVVWINREDDVGDEGLRTVKLSYHPAALLEKNKVIVAPHLLAAFGQQGQ